MHPRKVSASISTSELKPAESGYHYPFVAWTFNDHITRGGLRRQLRAFADCAYGGVMILPWGGTPYDFMSPPWLDRVAWAVEEAERQGMGVWLWDDWLFPSGFAGGELGKDDAHKSKKLKVLVDLTLEAGETANIPVPPRALAAGVFAINKYNNPAGPTQALAIKDLAQVSHRVSRRSRLVIVGWEMVSSICHTVRSHSSYLKKDPNSSVYTDDDEDAWSCDLLNPDTTRAYLDLIHEKYFQRLGSHFGNTLKGFFYDEPDLPTLRPWTPGLTEAFLVRKGYDLTPFLVSLMAPRSNMGYDHFAEPSRLITDQRLKSVLADYHDVWTSLFAENFYSVIHKWCRDHGVLSVGHQSSDESLRNLLCGSGTLMKNMDHVDMPGVDVIWGQVALGRFDDFPRLAGSRAALTGKPFALSESFAVQGHGADIDEMRFIAEHQIVRGINHFVVKMASYNPKKSYYYHPPELNPSANPVIRHFGALLHRRIAHLGAVLSRGRSIGKICLYVPLRNYYEQASEIAEQISALAKILAYRQREFDYAWDQDLENMSVRDGLLVSSGGECYVSLLIPADAHMTPHIRKTIKRLTQRGAKIVNSAEAALMENASCPLQFISSTECPVSMRRRQLDERTWVAFLLNESNDSQSLTLSRTPGWSFWDEDLSTGCEYAVSGKILFRPGESRLIFAGKGSAKPQLRAGAFLPLENWQLTLPDGTCRRLRGEFPSWHELGHGAYFGFLRYTTRFRWTSRSTLSALLDLGEVHYAAAIRLNGQEVCKAAFTPFCVVLNNLTRGENLLEIDVLNTPANAICGTEEVERKLERQGAFVGTYAPIYLPLDRKKIPSGLFGPVTLREVEFVPK